MDSEPFPGTEARPSEPVQPRGRQRGGIYGWSLRTTLRVLRAVNWTNALVILIVYPLGLLGSLASTSTSLAYIFLMVYCMMFGIILLCFECHLEASERMLRRYFGFLFSYIGRALFIAFVATICFGAQFWLGYLAGALTLVNAIFNCVIIFTHPAFTVGKVRGGSRDPTRGYSRGGVEAARAARHVYTENKDVANRAAKSAVSAGATYARDNPDVARRAAGAAVTYARDNPDVAREVVTAAATPSSSKKTSDGFDVSQL